MTWRIPCDEAELAVDLAARAEAMGISVAPHVATDPVREALELIEEGARVAVAMLTGPAVTELVTIARRAPGLPMALLDGPRTLARELGLAAAEDIGALANLLALREARVEHPWEASTRGLSPVDRRRLGDAARGGSTDQRWSRGDGGRLRLEHAGGSLLLGDARSVAGALDAAYAAVASARPRMPTVEGVDPDAVLEVILGPPRALSDPASKTALAAYDVPLPAEVLCTSPSRAASEASQLGFPVRLALASPDLRLWDHPDLVADGVDNAARVRDVFRQMMALGATRADKNRLLGVTVSATTSARALMRVEAESLADGWVRATLGFADPHGLAAGDETELLLPAKEADVARALRRLRGHPLLLGAGATAREAVVAQLTDLLLRVAAFIDEWRAEVDGVRIEPLAVLLDGTVEARDVCVQVGDAFTRSLRAAAP
ncbi:MAG: acetate--CoA ligase family protein [Deltaproteobacteria bacterium]|nr:acetate--CoA ligase family protein [Deltaproteobacteria bacterium]